MASATKQNLASLIKQGGGALGLDEASSGILIHNLNAGTLPMCQGSPFTDEEQETDDFRIIHFAFDGSGSMEDVEDELIACVNEIVIPGLLGGAAEQVGAIRIGGLSFNSTVRPLWQAGGDHGFYPLRDLPKLTKKDYRASGATALNKGALDSVTAAVAYALQIRDRTGSNPETTLVMFSDGANNQPPMDADDVYQVLSKLSSELFTLVFIGFETGERVDFHAVAQAMGYRDIQESKRAPGETPEQQQRRFRNMMRVYSSQQIQRTSRSKVATATAAPAGSSSGFWTP